MLAAFVRAAYPDHFVASVASSAPGSCVVGVVVVGVVVVGVVVSVVCGSMQNTQSRCTRAPNHQSSVISHQSSVTYHLLSVISHHQSSSVIISHHQSSSPLITASSAPVHGLLDYTITHHHPSSPLITPSSAPVHGVLDYVGFQDAITRGYVMNVEGVRGGAACSSAIASGHAKVDELLSIADCH
jgi:hypothetical protein